MITKMTSPNGDRRSLSGNRANRINPAQEEINRCPIPSVFRSTMFGSGCEGIGKAATRRTATVKKRMPMVFVEVWKFVHSPRSAVPRTIKIVAKKRDEIPNNALVLLSLVPVIMVMISHRSMMVQDKTSARGFPAVAISNPIPHKRRVLIHVFRDFS